MNLIMVSIDNSIFIEWSKIRNRLLEYSKMLDNLSVIIYSKKWFINFTIGENIHVYPTNSLTKIHFICDAYRIWKEISKDFDKNITVITTQDPFETWLIWYLLKIKFWFWLNIQIHTDPFSKFFIKESFLNLLRYLFFRFFLVYRADSIRTVSKNVKNCIFSMIWGDNIINIPIYSEIKINERINKDSKKFNILCLSRLEKVKNIWLVIDSINDLLSIYKNIELTIVWKWSQENRLRDYVRNNQLHEKIIFKPWTNDVWNEYRNSDLFILPSNYEWWWMTVIEAASYWVPIIMTNTWCAWDFLLNGYNGIVIDIWNKEQLQNAIIKIYNDTSFRKSCIKNWFEQIRKLPNKEETLKMYKDSWKMALPHKSWLWKKKK